MPIVAFGSRRSGLATGRAEIRRHQRGERGADHGGGAQGHPRQAGRQPGHRRRQRPRRHHRRADRAGQRDQRASAGPRDGHAAVHRRADLHRPDGDGDPERSANAPSASPAPRSASSPTARTPRPASRASRPQRMRQALDDGKIVIVAGFQGIDENCNITTLGRGGSDTTAVALAAVMKHDAAPGQPTATVGCEIYTDVDGIYTTDPRIVPEARKIDVDQLRRDAGAGQRRRRRHALAQHRVRQEVRRAAAGALVVQRRGGHLDRAGGRLDARGGRLRRRPGAGRGPRLRSTACRTGRASATASSPPSPSSNIVVDMIAQNVGSGGKASIGFTVLGNELHGRAGGAAAAGRRSWGATSNTTSKVSKVSIVGTGMRTHTGVAERMFAALAAESINMKMITTGDIKISVLGGQGRRRQGAAGGASGVRPAHSRGRGRACRRATGRDRTSADRPRRRGSGSGRDLAALTQQLGRHGGHRRQRRAAGDRPGPHHHLRPARSAGQLLAHLPGGGGRRHRRGHDRAEPERPAGPSCPSACRRPTCERRLTADARGRGRGSIRRDACAADAGHRQAVRPRRRHAHAHRRRPAACSAPWPQRGINISMINTSEVRVSVVVGRPARRRGAGVSEGNI